MLTQAGRFDVEEGYLVSADERDSDRILPPEDYLGGSAPLAVAAPAAFEAGDVQVESGVCVGCAGTDNPPTGDVNATSAVCAGCDPTADWFDGAIVAAHATFPTLALKHKGGTTDWRLDYNVGSSTARLGLDSNGSFTYPLQIENSTPSNTLYLNQSGNIGLGTATPTEVLHERTSGDLSFSSLLLDNEETLLGETSQFSLGVQGGWGFFLSDRTGSPGNWNIFRIEPLAPEQSLHIAASGNVGMGTDAPQSSLHVSSADGTAQVYVQEESASAAVRTLFQLTNNGAPRFALENATSGIEWSFQQSGPGNFLISLEGTGGPEMQVYQNGRVRMGPAGAVNFDLAPTGNLTIAGSLTASGSTFPDYVFESDYDLMPLTELRDFIEQEKHLPSIPSAEDVEKQGGHNMTELQLKMLEKIEE